MPRRLRRTTLVACGLVGACNPGVDDDQFWGLEEHRNVHGPDASAGTARTERALRFQVRTPLGLGRREIALSATSELWVFPTATLAGVSFSAGAFSVGDGARVDAVYAYGADALRVSPSARVSGYVRTGPNGVAPGHPLSTSRLFVGDGRESETFSWTVPLPRLDGRCRIRSSHSPWSLEPGAFGSADVEPGAVLGLRSGSYHFGRFSLPRGAKLELDNADGPVYVWVANSLDLTGETREHFAAGNWMLGYAGSEAVEVQGLRGTLVAPLARVSLEAGVHEGAVFAAAILVQPGARVRARPFSVDPLPEDHVSTCRACARAQSVSGPDDWVSLDPKCLDCSSMPPPRPSRYHSRCPEESTPGGSLARKGKGE